MLHRPTSWRTLFGALALALLFIAGPAQAQSLDDLRAAGKVGERYDGFAVARDPSAQGFVDQVNAERRQIYQRDAAAQGVSADQVGKVYAQQIIDRAPSGTFFLSEGGAWRQK